MVSGEFDSRLGRQLNDVALPAGLLPRLYDIAALGDDELDLRLRDVPLPTGLVERLADVIADEELDEQLRDVAVPVSMLTRTRIIPDRRQRSALRQWALAASLLLMVGAGTLALVGGMVSSVRPVEPPALALVVIDQGPLDLVSPLESAVAIVPETPPPRARAVGGFSDETMAMLTTFDRPQLGPAGQLAADLHTVWDPWDNWLWKRWGALGYAPVGGPPLPELTALSAPVAQGREAPLVRGYDREFLYAYAVQPPTLTALDADARSLDVPLVTDTESFDRAVRLAAEGRVPRSEQVRVEHFLSAVQPGQLVEAEPGRLVIGTAAGPSVFNPSAAGLLQVGVQAGMARRRSLSAAHLVLAIDASASMSFRGGLDRVRRAAADATRYLGPDDRLSMMVFADEVVEIVREVRGDDRTALEEAQRLLEQAVAPAGGSNLGAALQQAISAAIESESSANLPRRVVLVTASPPLLADKDADGIRQMFAEAAKGDFRFEICDVAREDDVAAAWQALAASVGGTVRRPLTADALCWALVEALTGDSSLAATDVKMRIEFNPKAVAAYRLIGHESTALGGLLPAATEVDLHVGQGASALFEIWFYPNEEDDVASVRVQWTDPADGKSRQAGPQRISRLQFATALQGSALSLQAAAVAAEGAEVLRQSFNFALAAPDRYRYEPKPSGLKHVLAQADRVSAALAQQPRFRRLVDLLEALSGLVGEREAASARFGVRGIIADQWREYGSK